MQERDEDLLYLLGIQLDNFKQKVFNPSGTKARLSIPMIFRNWNNEL